MTAQEQIASLEQQLNEALERLKEATELLRETQEQLQQAQSRIAELEKQKTPPPAFVKAKANKKKPKNEENQPRKKREAHSNHARRRGVPTQIVEHRIVACPDCHLRLGGIS
jgi:transposase